MDKGSESIPGSRIGSFRTKLWKDDFGDIVTRYHNAMKPPPDNPEFTRFTGAMRDILKVSKTEMNRRIEAEKKRKSKTSASPVSAVASKRAN